MHSDYVCETWAGGDGRYHGRFPDLPQSEFSVSSEGELEDAAREAFSRWTQWAERIGAAIPRPGSRGQFNGIRRISVGRSTHRHLLNVCQKSDIPLAGLVTSILLAGLDWIEGDFTKPVLDPSVSCFVDPLPVKGPPVDYSKTKATGSWTQNIPIDLHQRLSIMAGVESLSMDALTNLLISRVLAEMLPRAKPH